MLLLVVMAIVRLVRSTEVLRVKLRLLDVWSHELGLGDLWLLEIGLVRDVRLVMLVLSSGSPLDINSGCDSRNGGNKESFHSSKNSFYIV